ncbi:efflux RND transporter periplasmic adaptor subunit [Bacteroidota bacterium]
MKKQTIYILISIVVVLIVAIVIYNRTNKEEQENIFTTVKRGLFEIFVVTTGELQAENSIKINAPVADLRNIHIWDISIAELVPEGTVVDSGDVVAVLDDTKLNDEAIEEEERLQSQLAELQNEIVDSTITLSKARDNIVNLRFKVEEAEIKVEQSVYESPAIKRQAEIELEQTKRQLSQEIENYGLLVQKAEVRIKQRRVYVGRYQRRIDEINDVKEKMTLYAPSDGMVIYFKERDGSKRKKGTNLRLWGDGEVATLPDLTSMVSKTFVNEIDISKVKVGQTTTIGIDAFSEKQFTGEVTNVANIGEQVSGSDAKVFEVLVKMHEHDTVLRPAMTTSNAILTASYEDTLFIPLEALHSNDSLFYVIKEKGIQRIKQVVLTGISNENFILIAGGLKEGDKILLSIPDPSELNKLEYSGMELLLKKNIEESNLTMKMSK